MPVPEPPPEKVVYSNWTRLNGTPYDVALDFGYRTDDGPPKNPAVHVVMTWEEAKEVLTLLANAIETYEKAAGSIREFGVEIVPATEPKKPPPRKRK